MRTGTGMRAVPCILIRIRTRTNIETRAQLGGGVTCERLLIICCSVTE